MAPGMAHCAGGTGPVNFGGLGQQPSSDVDADHDVLEALDRWVEQGKAPRRLIASTYAAPGTPQRQMPICPYPAVATYAGGDKDKAESFQCRWPKPL